LLVVPNEQISAFLRKEDTLYLAYNSRKIDIFALENIHLESEGNFSACIK
jgi:hypothetical protein